MLEEILQYLFSHRPFELKNKPLAPEKIFCRHILHIFSKFTPKGLFYQKLNSLRNHLERNGLFNHREYEYYCISHILDDCEYMYDPVIVEGELQRVPEDILTFLIDKLSIIGKDLLEFLHLTLKYLQWHPYVFFTVGDVTESIKYGGLYLELGSDKKRHQWRDQMISQWNGLLQEDPIKFDQKHVVESNSIVSLSRVEEDIYKYIRAKVISDRLGAKKYFKIKCRSCNCEVITDIYDLETERRYPYAFDLHSDCFTWVEKHDFQCRRCRSANLIFGYVKTREWKQIDEQDIAKAQKLSDNETLFVLSCECGAKYTLILKKREGSGAGISGFDFPFHDTEPFQHVEAKAFQCEICFNYVSEIYLFNTSTLSD